MIIVKESEARYEMRADDQSLIGTITRGPLGWHWRNARGSGPRHPRSTPLAAVQLAEAFKVLRPDIFPDTWKSKLEGADAVFAHNQRVAKGTAR